LKELNLTKNDISDVVLAGGSAKINRVQDIVQEYFAPVDIHKSIMPEEVIAYGAAVEGIFFLSNS
jgi:molecular chaperone DnaK (HSP70)